MDLRKVIIDKLKEVKSLTFVEICEYTAQFGFSEWDVATTLPAMCKEGILQKGVKKIKKRRFLTIIEETETRYFLR